MPDKNDKEALKPILFKEEIEKIKAEELLRIQIRNELRPTETEKNKVLNFFNSTVGIWLLSTVAVGLITFLYTTWTDSRKQSHAKQEAASDIDLEMSNRVFDAETALRKANTYMKYESAVYDFLNSASMPKQLSRQTILNKYEDYSTRALIIELSKLVGKDEKNELKNVLKAVNEISVLYDRPVMNSGQYENDAISSEDSITKNKILVLISHNVEINRWRLNQ